MVQEKTPHFLVNGNKWHKLKFNLLECLGKGVTRVATFGGAYSNHLVALAEVANRLQLETIGIIRGEQPKELSHTLKDAQDLGMQLHFVSRGDYRRRYDRDYIRLLNESLGFELLIPEGGNNAMGVLGCAHWGQQLKTLYGSGEFTHWITPVGTGASLAGLSLSVCDSSNSYCEKTHKQISQSDRIIDVIQEKVIGVAVLKNADYLTAEVQQWHDELLSDGSIIESSSQALAQQWQLYTKAHGGGYGKWNHEIVNFIHLFRSVTGIQLDQIYTAKMMQALPKLKADGLICAGDRVLAIHSGGMQGIRSIPALL